EVAGLHSYGMNRRRLELAAQELFDSHLVVRLPGLVGPGLRKNALFDLHNGNNVAALDSRSTYQFYPMVNLWSDLRRAISQKLRLVHLTAEPLSMAEVALEGFGRELVEQRSATPA